MIKKHDYLMLVLAGIAILSTLWFPNSIAATPVPLVGSSRESFVTAHYVITSSASQRETMLVADAVERLHASYLDFFADSIPSERRKTKLKLTLYRDREDFRQHNKAASWAEAFYKPPSCHAYFARGERNPHHWMLHEATHQLNHEVGHFPNSKWINEGLATYFGTSTIRNGKLIPGDIDSDTYPLWGVARLSLSGDRDADVRNGKIISLRALISGAGGPNIDDKFNAYYIGYWSLTHFLFHSNEGRYARRYQQLIRSGGGLQEFERIIGPIERIENEWYVYLKDQVELQKAQRRERRK
jgi:hypothetical protein